MQRLTRLGEENPDPVLRVFPDGRIQYKNPASLQLCSEWNGDDSQRVPPVVQEIVAAACSKVETLRREVVLGEHTYLVTVAPAPHPADYLNVFVHEITERKQAETALAQAKRASEWEQGILQAIMDGSKNSHLVYLDRNFNFVRVNETYAQTCGYRPEEMIGKNHFALYPHAENEAIFARVRDTGEPFEIRDKPFEFPDQPERGVTYWDWTLTPVKNPDGQVEGLIFSLHETTERNAPKRPCGRVSLVIATWRRRWRAR